MFPLTLVALGLALPAELSLGLGYYGTRPRYEETHLGPGLSLEGRLRADNVVSLVGHISAIRVSDTTIHQVASSGSPWSSSTRIVIHHHYLHVPLLAGLRFHLPADITLTAAAGIGLQRDTVDVEDDVELAAEGSVNHRGRYGHVALAWQGPRWLDTRWSGVLSATGGAIRISSDPTYVLLLGLAVQASWGGSTVLDTRR